MLLTSLTIFAFFGTSLAAPWPDTNTASSTSTAPALQPTICGDIVNSGDVIFTAKDAYDCLTSVPFVPAVATRFLKYINDTIQFQSTLAYLKNPPASYQQPSIDFLKGLDQIQQNIDNGQFANEYVFEATLQNLIYSTHDAHVTLSAGILAVFTFASPYGIVSVSEDGLQTPKVYISDDLVEAQYNNVSWHPSAITMINGQDVTDYLTQFAALNAIGGLEPNADWNQLMSSPALDIQNLYSIFEGLITFYPGENIAFTFENGTSLDPEPWLAIYNSQGDTGPLSTGGDFYNFFVLGLYPASYNSSATSAAATSGATAAATSAAASSAPAAASSSASTPTSWDNSAYPTNPAVVQPDFGATGVLSGYFLHDISVAVLSIPSFQSPDVESFSDTIGNFIKQSKDAGLQKVLIDLQQNGGGDTFLAIDAFKQFFPTLDPFGGSRLRAHATADVLGNTFTNYYTPSLNESYYDDLTVSDWVATDLIDASTGQNFTSWGELYGPKLYNGDYFTTVQQYNLSSFIYDEVASGGIVVYGYNDRPATSPQPYAAEDIVILSDGLCSSACALFMEMMHHEGGVSTVAVGGRPSDGPMQAPSGSRGAQYYNFEDLDSDIAFAIEINATAGSYLPDRSEDVYITYAGFNIRDQIRKDGTTPLQFVYEAATCRIFYTPQTIYNFSNLWTYAANATWTTPSLCVQGSTGYATTGTSTDTTGPPDGSTSLNGDISHNMTGVLALSGVQDDFRAEFSGQELDTVVRLISKIGSLCGKSSSTNAGCSGGGTFCHHVTSCGKSSHQCVRACNPYNQVCGNQCHYPPNSFIELKGHGAPKKVASGFCPPQATCSSEKVVGPDTPGLPPHIQDDGAPNTRGEYIARGTPGDFVMAGLAE